MRNKLYKVKITIYYQLQITTNIQSVTSFRAPCVFWNRMCQRTARE